MVELLSFCGLDCGKCPAHLATQNNDQEGLAKTAADWSKRFGMEIRPEDIICDGCATSNGRKAAYCSECEIRLCCRKKNLENCAFCRDYICEKLENFFKDAPEAKENLEEIRG